MSGDVVEMKNDWFVDVIGNGLITAHDLVAALQVKGASVVRQQLRVADDDRHTNATDFIVGDRFEHHLRSYSGRISHRNAYARA